MIRACAVIIARSSSNAVCRLSKIDCTIRSSPSPVRCDCWKK
jgi:hypothetical protein